MAGQKVLGSKFLRWVGWSGPGIFAVAQKDPRGIFIDVFRTQWCFDVRAEPSDLVLAVNTLFLEYWKRPVSLRDSGSRQSWPFWQTSVGTDSTAAGRK